MKYTLNAYLKKKITNLFSFSYKFFSIQTEDLRENENHNKKGII